MKPVSVTIKGPGKKIQQFRLEKKLPANSKLVKSELRKFGNGDEVLMLEIVMEES